MSTLGDSAFHNGRSQQSVPMQEPYCPLYSEGETNSDERV